MESYIPTLKRLGSTSGMDKAMCNHVLRDWQRQKTKAKSCPVPREEETEEEEEELGGQQPCRQSVKTWQGLIPGQRAHHCQHHGARWAARRHSPAWPAAVPAAPSVTVWLVLLSSPSSPSPTAICSPNKMAASQNRAQPPSYLPVPVPAPTLAPKR